MGPLSIGEQALPSARKEADKFLTNEGENRIELPHFIIAFRRLASCSSTSSLQLTIASTSTLTFFGVWHRSSGTR